MYTIQTKVRGVSFENRGGSSRQEIIRRHCKKEGYLYLKCEPDNPHDENAVAVYCKYKKFFGGAKRKQIGYLSKDLAEQLHEEINEGQVVSKIIEVTGSWWDIQGVNIELKVHDERGR